MKLNKQQIASMLADALNIMNDLQMTLSDHGETKLQGEIHNFLAKIPKCILESVDFANNGTVRDTDILMTLTNIR
jgi:hypothetical protein